MSLRSCGEAFNMHKCYFEGIVWSKKCFYEWKLCFILNWQKNDKINVDCLGAVNSYLKFKSSEFCESLCWRFQFIRWRRRGGEGRSSYYVDVNTQIYIAWIDFLVTQIFIQIRTSHVVMIREVKMSQTFSANKGFAGSQFPCGADFADSAELFAPN